MPLRKLSKWTLSDRRWWQRYSLPFGDYNIRHDVLHPFGYIDTLCRKVKWFWQRGIRGYADNSVWSLDWYLTSFMGDALRDLAKQVHGTPIIDTGRPLDPNDPNDCDTLTMDEWKATILYLAETFDVGRQIEDFTWQKVEEYEKAHKRFQHGMRMFAEYFFNLWD